MEIDYTIDFEQNNAKDNLEKANTNVNECHEKLHTTHQRKKTGGVSKCVRLTVKQQSCLVFLCVMTGVCVSLAEKEQSSTAIEATSQLPCCEDVYGYEYYNYSEYKYDYEYYNNSEYMYDYEYNNYSEYDTPSQDGCRPCGNRIDIKDDINHAGNMTNTRLVWRIVVCCAIVLSILVLLNN